MSSVIGKILFATLGLLGKEMRLDWKNTMKSIFQQFDFKDIRGISRQEEHWMFVDWLISDYNTLTFCWQSKKWNKTAENYTALAFLWWVWSVSYAVVLAVGKESKLSCTPLFSPFTVATLVRFTGWAFIPILQTGSCVIIMAHVVAE